MASGKWSPEARARLRERWAWKKKMGVGFQGKVSEKCESACATAGFHIASYNAGVLHGYELANKS